MNGILLINKPAGLTSHDVVNKIRRLTHMKVGHSGTLDPQATGLLIVLVGSATKLTPYLNNYTKEYIASCQLGLLTDTQDIWGKTLETSFVPELKGLKDILDSFVGDSTQKTPMVSAVRVKGKKLYEYHRENIEIETPTRQIHISEMELLNSNEAEFSFRTVVSSGTYIRTLCVDIAKQLGTIGAMSSLCRSQIGPFRLEDALELNDLTHETVISNLINKKVALSHYEMIDVPDINPVIQGKKLVLETDFDEVVVCFEDEVYAIYQREYENTFRSKRGLW